MGDYNVYVITKDAIEPIIISLKKIQDFQLVEKLSPEERDDIMGSNASKLFSLKS